MTNDKSAYHKKNKNYDKGHRGPPSPYMETVASGGWNIEKEYFFTLDGSLTRRGRLLSGAPVKGSE